MRVWFGAHFRTRLWPLLACLFSGLALLLAIEVFLCLPAVAKAAPTAASFEYDVKAAFLLNFTKFVEWPSAAFAAPDAPLTICIVGDDPFGRAIDQIVEGESVNGHRIVIERKRHDQQRSCHVLYISSGGALTNSIISGGSAVLTVGEGEEFIRQGGIIAFVVDNRRVRFDINLRAASSAGLKLSSKLLSVARSVDK
jgi:hypothetical protein